MPSTTTRAALRYPLGTEAPDGPTEIGNLAADIDALLLIWKTGTTAAKPAAAANGRLYYETDGDRISYDMGSSWRKVLMQTVNGRYTADGIVDATGYMVAGVSAGLVPAGSISIWPLASPPSGYVMCDGASYLRADGTHDALFAVIGTTYGAADGTHFNVPDITGRVVVGYAASGGHADVNTIGANDGVAKANRRPKHNSTLSGAPGIGSLGLTGSPSINSDSAVKQIGAGNGQQQVTTNADHIELTLASISAALGSLAVTGAPSAGTLAVGPGGTAPIDTPAYIALNYIIKL